ncbi:MAG: fibronectin type III domain-containing protein, partial [Calditrichota bacterium]
PTQASLIWQAPTGELDRYYLYRSGISGSGYVLIDSVNHPTTAYNDNSLTPETRYYYVVSASNIWGESPFSNEDSIDTPGIIPSAPGSIAAQGVSESQINLNWKPATFAARYRIFRSLTSGVGYALIDSVDAPDSSYSNIGLDPDTEYFYQITAQNVWGESVPSEEVSATTGNSGAPSAPQELSVNPVSTTELRLEWLVSATGNPLRYRIFRSATPGSGFIAVDSINHPQTVYINASLSPSTEYFYRVSAVNEFGESPSSAEAGATTFGAPTVPEGLSAIAISEGQIDLSWTVSSGEPVRYRIFRSLSSSGGFALIDSVDHPQSSYADSSVNELTTYYYKIAALNQWGISMQTVEVSATTPGSGTPTAPTNLIAGTVSNTQLLLSWETSTANPERYLIYRSLLPQSGFIKIDSTVHPVAGYVDTSLQPSTTYYYQVSALNGSGESPASNSAAGTTFGPPSQPMNPSAQAISTSEINLSWAASSGNPARYRVYRSLNSGSGFTKIDSVSHPATGVIDIQLQEETIYYYFITAFNQWGESISSIEISAQTDGQTTIVAPSINAASIQGFGR